MKQVFLSQGKAIVKEVPQPLLDDNMVLVEVAYSCISSGTERATLNATGQSLAQRMVKQGQQNIAKVLETLQKSGLQTTISLVRNKLDQVIAVGYSCSGKVVACGSKVTALKVGDLVACAGAGFAVHGQFVVVPELLAAKIAQETSLRAASATTLGAIALHGLRRAQLNFDDIVCIQGLGLLGLIAVQLAVKAGYRVIGVDINEERMALARTYGAFCVINATCETALKQLNYATEHLGADATIVTAPGTDPAILEFAISATRRKGKIVVVGDAQISVAREELYTKEIDLLISCSYGPGRYDSQYEMQGIDYPYAYVRWTENRNLKSIARLIDEGALNFDALLATEFPIQDASQAYESLSKSSALGVILTYQDHAEVVNPQEMPKQDDFAVPAIHFKKAKDTVNIGWIGTGGFSITELLPTFLANPKVKLHALADTHIQTVVNAARQFNVENYTNDYKHLLADDAIDAFVIATPHKFHTDQLLTILGTGKAVFVEKPISINELQLQQLSQFHAQMPHAPWHVDFNRRHAPMIVQTKNAVAHRSSPLMITYRVNAGFLPATHWIQSAEQGGRIVGEVCHFTHLLIFLVGSLVSRITVSTAGWGRKDMSNADTLSVQLSFADGSVANIVYASNGNTTLEKERMEIFWDGKAITLEDYRVLQGFGLGATFNRMMRTPDKGYTDSINYFVDGLINGDLMTHVGERQRALYATDITLKIDQLARAGGGVYDLGAHSQKLTQAASDEMQEPTMPHNNQSTIQL